MRSKKLCRNNPIDVLVEKLCHTSKCHIITTPVHTGYYSHPMNSTLGRDVVPLAEDFIERSENVLWRTMS